jgi:hypothetical protein
MADRKDKKFYRELKRSIKKEGSKKRRAFYKQNLTNHPEEAHLCEDYDFGDLSSKPFNGMDNDMTRRREEKPDDESPINKILEVDCDHLHKCFHQTQE